MLMKRTVNSFSSGLVSKSLYIQFFHPVSFNLLLAFCSVFSLPLIFFPQFHLSQSVSISTFQYFLLILNLPVSLRPNSNSHFLIPPLHLPFPLLYLILIPPLPSLTSSFPPQVGLPRLHLPTVAPQPSQRGPTLALLPRGGHHTESPAVPNSHAQHSGETERENCHKCPQ